MTTIPQNEQLLNHLTQLLQAHRPVFKQERVFQRVALLVIAEIVVFARHTITQLLMGLGLTEMDWSSWYRLFSHGRFPYDEASAVLFGETLKHVAVNDVYVVAGDGTQTRRSSRKMEGAHWLHNPQSPVFKRGIHIAQRWFNGSWLLPAENGYSRAVPLRWQPAFTEKSQPQHTAPCKEWEAAVAFLVWLKQQLATGGRKTQRILMVADGHYDTLNLWKHLPVGVILLARSAKNRVLWHLPDPDARKNRKYGQRAPAPADYWRQRTGWQRLVLTVRGKQRHLQVQVAGPFLRKGGPGTAPLSHCCPRQGQQTHAASALAVSGECRAGCGRRLDAALASGRPAVLGLAALGGRSCSPRIEVQLRLGQQAVLAAYCCCPFRAVECLGLCLAPIGRVSLLGVDGSACGTYPLVAGEWSLVVEYIMARLSRRLVG